MNLKADNSPIALLGIPYDLGSSFMRGAAEGPDKIREVLHNGASNYCSEAGVDIFENGQLVDKGNIEVSQYLHIEQSIASLLQGGFRCLVLGGDHSITYPIIKAYHLHHNPVHILHFDAHPDLYDELDGNRHSHACPFARIMESGLASRLVQVGIRTLNQHQRDQAKRLQVEIIEMKDICRLAALEFSAPVYISIDLDCLDPGFAPGVSHHEPGGMSVREILTCIQNITVPIIGADIVEYNPERDVHNMTASVAAKLLKEIAGKMICP